MRQYFFWLTFFSISISLIPIAQAEVSPEQKECIVSSAQQYNIPAAIFFGILEVGGGSASDEIGPDDHKHYELGALQVNSQWVGQIAKDWHIPSDQMYDLIKNNVCANTNAAAWLLKRDLENSHSLGSALLKYKSDDEELGYPFAKKLADYLSKQVSSVKEPHPTFINNNSLTNPSQIKDESTTHIAVASNVQPQYPNPFLGVLFIFGIFGGLIWLFIYFWKKTAREYGQKACPNCGSISRGKPRGSPAITFMLLLFFFIPGLIYSTWRSSGGRTICPYCKSPGLIPLDTPHGQSFAKKPVIIRRYTDS